MPEIKKVYQEPKNNTKPGIPGKKLLISGCNFTIDIQSLDPYENFNDMCNAAIEIYRILRKLDGF